MSKPKRRGAPVFRPIHCEIWTDDKFAELSTNAKLTFIYLLTNARTTPCGVYPVSIRQGAYETGLTQKQFEDSVCELVDRVRIGYAYDTNEVCIINWSKYNGSDSPKWTKAVEDSLAFVKSSKLRDIASGKDTVCIPYAYPMHTLPNRDRERERDRDTSKAQKYPMHTLSPEAGTALDYPDFHDAWSDWQQHRREIKKKLTPTSAKSQLAKLAREVEQGNDPVAIIRNSIAGGYQGLFAPKDTPKHDIPTLDQVLAWFKAKEDDPAVADQQGLLFYSHYNSIGWRVNGQAVTSWVSLAIKWREK